MNRRYLILISLFLLFGAALRLYDLTDAPIDFHATRQLRGAIVARGIYYEMLPDADPATRALAMSFRASTGQYEPSILEGLAALTYLAAGQEIWWVARIYNTLFWLIGGLALLALALRLGTRQSGTPPAVGQSAAQVAALFVLAFYLVLPFSVQASRSFQPDPGMVMWMALSAWAIYRWSETVSESSRGNWRWALAAGLFSGMALLTKAVSIYTVAGGIIALLIYAYGLGRARPWYRPLQRIVANPQVWLMAALSLGPTLLYYLTRQDRASEYLSSWTLSLSHLLLNPRFYAGWLSLMAELLTVPALLLALAGIWAASSRARALLIGLWVGYLLYGLFLPYQMDTHSYYHLQLVWLVALSMAPLVQLGAGWLLRRPRPQQWAGLALALALLALGSWQALVPLYGQNYRNEAAYWSEIASYLPADGKYVALTQDYGYRLMYYGWRKVTLWPNRGELKLSVLRGSNKEFEAYFYKRIEGKSYFLVTAFNQFNDQPALRDMLANNYALIAQGPGYLIFDLRSAVAR